MEISFLRDFLRFFITLSFVFNLSALFGIDNAGVGTGTDAARFCEKNGGEVRVCPDVYGANQEICLFSSHSIIEAKTFMREKNGELTLAVKHYKNPTPTPPYSGGNPAYDYCLLVKGVPFNIFDTVASGERGLCLFPEDGSIIEQWTLIWGTERSPELLNALNKQ